jgi:tetratricopeptide (TPR) repeat protein
VHARLALDLSERYFSGYDIPAALIHYKRAETILKQDSENLDLARLYVSMAKTANYLMAYEDGLEWSNRAMEIAQRLKSDEVWAWAAAERGEHLHFLGRQRESLDILSCASELAQKINSPHTGSRVAVLFGDCFWNLWDPRRAQECYLAELAKQQLVKQSHVRRNFEIALGENYIFSGDLEQARQLRISENWQRFAEGTWEEMAIFLRKYTDFVRKAGNRHYAAETPLWTARTMVWSGKPREARDLVIEGLAARPDDPHLTIAMRPTLALAHTLLGAYDQAEAELYLVRKELAKGENWRGSAGDPLRAEAALAAAQRRFDEAEACFAKAIDTFRTYVLPWERADTLYWWASACRQAGDGNPGSREV